MAVAETPTPMIEVNSQDSMDPLLAAKGERDLAAFLEAPQGEAAKVPQTESTAEASKSDEAEEAQSAPAKPAADEVPEVETSVVMGPLQCVVGPTQGGPQVNSVLDPTSAAQMPWKTCQKCQLPVEPDQVVPKNNGKNIWCKVCNAATTMLSRNMKWPMPGFPALEPQRQIAFWQQCGQIVKEQGHLSYARLRASLCMQLTEKKMEVNATKFSSEFLPLSVWEARGFEADKVLQGLQETHPILGTTYAVPLKTVSREHIQQTIEEMITKFEAEARHKKIADAKPKAQPAIKLTAEQEPSDADLFGEGDAESLAWMMPPSPHKRKVEEVDDQNETPTVPDAKSRKREETAIKKHNAAVKKLCEKAKVLIAPPREQIQVHLVNKQLLPGNVVQDLETMSQDLKDVDHECNKGLKVPGENERLEDPPFDLKKLTSFVKEMKGKISNADRILKLLQPKAKAKAKAKATA